MKLLRFSHEKYVMKVLQRFNMQDAKPIDSTLSTNYKLNANQCPKMKVEKAKINKIPYASTIGSLMYTMVCTRPDIGYAVEVVSRYMSNPTREPWAEVKRILRYLRGTSNVCLRFGSSNPMLEGFNNSDMSANVDTSRSMSGYGMPCGGRVVSWQSRLQKVVALSTTKAEYMAAAEANKEIIWMKEFIGELGIRQEEFQLHCDN